MSLQTIRNITLSFVIALIFIPAYSQDLKPYLGRWDLTLKAADHEYPSWLELTESSGKLSAQFVGRWGNARPLPKAEIADGMLTFVSPKEEEASKSDLVFQGKLTGDTLSGTVNAPDGGTWSWTGKRAPSLKRTKEPTWGKPIKLFNGKDLAGWQMSDPNSKNPWKVVDGNLVSPTHGPEIINDRKFNDFKLHVEFNCADNSNSGVYLRGRYEVQVETNSIQEPPSHHMGGVYGFIAPNPEQRFANQWQTYDITLIGRTITVAQNGKTIIDHQEIPGITGGALDSNEELPGPIYLQGSEDGHVMYRSIVLTPAKD
ncbi:MAG TPA: DUF1080 domain-containing protein [Terriglobales bacterium]|nr:DUF1080 domain-containing protein [Terriglobales bacterium]